METRQAAHPAPRTLAAFALDRLTAEARERLQMHLRSCAACSDFLAQTPQHELQALLGSAERSRAEQSTPGERSRDTIQSPDPPVRAQASVGARPPNPAIPATATEPIPAALREQSKYRVVRLLGRGGMGSVYEARHERMDRRVAIKVINPELVDHPQAIERFNAEVQAVSKLDHANVARAYDAETFGSLQAIIMEFVEGQTLYDFLKARQRAGVQITVIEACRLVRQSLLGLQHAHERGIAHRDLKPQNLMLTRDKGIVKILDFGLAKLTSGRSGLTKSNITMGTYEYMAPEQALDAATADTRADIYSLGCTLYYLLAGVLPFAHDTDVKLLLAHQNEIPRPLVELRPDVPQELSDLVAQMLAKNPADRPQTPADIAQSLLPHAKAEVPALAAQGADAAGQNVLAMLGQISAAPVALGSRRRTSARRAQNSALRRYWLPAAIASAALLGGIILFGGLFKVRTPDGTIALRVSEPNAEVLVDGQTITVHWGDDGKTAEITAPPGKHRIEVKKQGFVVSGTDVTLEDGGNEILIVALESSAKPPPSRIVTSSTTAESAAPSTVASMPPDSHTATIKDPAFQQWMKNVAAMPAEQQLDAVSNKLQEINPGSDGKLTDPVLLSGTGGPFAYQSIGGPMGPRKPGMVENGVVRQIGFSAEHVSDISPLRALPGLTWLHCVGTATRKGVLSDLSPLRGMHLFHMDISYTRVCDLSPITELPLQTFACGGTNVSDLAPLKGMPLTMLDCGNSPVSDLSPLKGMPLNMLAIEGTPSSDLSPLAGMNLWVITLTPKNITKGMDAIRQMKTLGTIGVGRAMHPASEFWRKYDAGEFGKPDSTATNAARTLPAAEGAASEAASPVGSDNAEPAPRGTKHDRPGEANRFVPLFDGKSLDGWTIDGDDNSGWSVEQGAIVAQGVNFKTRNYLLTDREYSDYVLRLEFSVEAGSNGGVDVRATPGEMLLLASGSHIIDHPVIKLTENPGKEQTGTTNFVIDGMYVAPNRPAKMRPAGAWNQMEVSVQGTRLTVKVNGTQIVNTSIRRDARFPDGTVPGLCRKNGRIGLQKHTGTVRYHNIEVMELPFQGIAQLLKTRKTLTFPRETLEKSLHLLFDDIGVRYQILGGDLQLAGITKDQSFSLDEREEPAEEILRKILLLANTDGKLTYAIMPTIAGGPEMLFITTRAAAEKRGDTSNLDPLEPARTAPAGSSPESRNGPLPALLRAPFDGSAAKAAQRQWAKHLNSKVVETNSIGMTLTLIPPGEFLMGSPETESGRQANERQHRVRITRPFYIGIDDVTLGNFLAFCNAVGYKTEAETDGKGGGGFGSDGKVGQKAGYTFRNWGRKQTNDHPVVNVSWNDAVAFCTWLSMKEGKSCRLPTEAEWEYACRAGTTTAFHYGDSLSSKEANCSGSFPYGGAAKGPSVANTTPVGSYRPNAFGLYDMHGDVNQWCADWYDEDYYQNSPSNDPPGPSAGTFRVLRGGGWFVNPALCRSAYRGRGEPTQRSCNIGFRVVCER